LFLALPASGSTPTGEHIVPLYEYRHAESGRRLYALETQNRAAPEQTGWTRSAEPLCRVWKTPAGPALFDRASSDR
jgi:hypothetical protein